MRELLGCLGGALIIVLVLLDAFEALVSPRRVTRRLRPTRFFYVVTWAPWRAIGCAIKSKKKREGFLSIYGPLSLLLLFALWAFLLVFAFGLLHWALQTPLHLQTGNINPFVYFYFSGTTLFTLGYGDATPDQTWGRLLAVSEAGLGLGFLALVISYLPILYQAFSNREMMITMLDARAGSPPTAVEILTRLNEARRHDTLETFLAQWERWAAELLESHLSYPVLSYYRSQHDNQSWLAALTAILDTSAVVMAGMSEVDPYQARLTFAMARHATADLALILNARPVAPKVDRLTRDVFQDLTRAVHFDDDDAAFAKLTELRKMYEPFISTLSSRFLMDLPPFVPQGRRSDNWQTTAWQNFK